MNKIAIKVQPGLAGGVNRVQVGCGPKNLLKDWWNVDLRDFSGVDQVFDATMPWPFANCLKYIYAEHFLEHLTFDQAVKFLDNAKIAMVDGGRLRITTPSLEWVLKTHFTFEKKIESVIDQTFAINRAFKGWGHQFLYSKETIRELLNSRGYSSIEFFEYGNSNDPNLINLERHGGHSVAKGFPSVWIVEASGDASIKADSAFSAIGHLQFSKYVESGH